MRKDADTDGILRLSTGGSATIRIFCTIVYVATGRGPTISTRGTFARCSIRRFAFCQCMVIPLRFAWPVRTAGDTAADAHFTAGVVEVTWRRLPKSNPRQSTLADFR